MKKRRAGCGLPEPPRIKRLPYPLVEVGRKKIPLAGRGGGDRGVRERGTACRGLCQLALPRRATVAPPALSTEIRIYRNVLNRKTEGGGGHWGTSVCV